MESKEQPVSVNHLAHDINNILTRILNSVELLKKKVSNYDDVSALLSSIENGTYMAAEIIEDVLAETSQQVSRKKRIHINTLITDLINTISIHSKSNINFKLKLDPQINMVEGRYSDLYRVLMNLIINAIEAIKGKGTITIFTTSSKEKVDDKNEPGFFQNTSFVQIKISDDGSGIDSSVMPYIFDDKFSTKSKRKNSGIGLAIVKKIIDDYNGIIKVTSESGKGTEFTIKLPSLMQSREFITSKKKTILIAEDEDIQRELLAELLVSYDFSVISVRNGEEVLNELKKGKNPDLLIIDQKMPDMNGLTCIKKIREKKMKVPVILASGSRSDNSNKDEIYKGVDKTINKPYNFEEMLSLIRELIY